MAETPKKRSRNLRAANAPIAKRSARAASAAVVVAPVKKRSAKQEEFSEAFTNEILEASREARELLKQGKLRSTTDPLELLRWMNEE